MTTTKCLLNDNLGPPANSATKCLFKNRQESTCNCLIDITFLFWGRTKWSQYGIAFKHKKIPGIIDSHLTKSVPHNVIVCSYDYWTTQNQIADTEGGTNDSQFSGERSLSGSIKFAFEYPRFTGLQELNYTNQPANVCPLQPEPRSIALTVRAKIILVHYCTCTSHEEPLEHCSKALSKVWDNAFFLESI